MYWRRFKYEVKNEVKKIVGLSLLVTLLFSSINLAFAETETENTDTETKNTETETENIQTYPISNGTIDFDSSTGKVTGCCLNSNC